MNEQDLIAERKKEAEHNDTARLAALARITASTARTFRHMPGVSSMPNVSASRASAL